MKKWGKAWLLDLEILIQYTKESYTYSELCRKIGIPTNGNSLHSLQRRLIFENIDISHFDKGKYTRGKTYKRSTKISNEDCFKINPLCSNSTVRDRIVKNQLLEYKCQKCNLGSIWNNEEIVLQLDHINGNNKDNRLENLRFLCPNCHSQTETFGSRKNKIHKCSHCDRIISSKNLRCKDCRHFQTENEKHMHFNQRKVVDRPSIEILKKEIDESSYLAVGRKYGVSDNTIRKWLK